MLLLYYYIGLVQKGPVFIINWVGYYKMGPFLLKQLMGPLLQNIGLLPSGVWLTVFCLKVFCGLLPSGKMYGRYSISN